MARKKMKLYVWEGVLVDYSPGVMFAVATSAEEARQVILKDHNLPSVQKDLKGTPDEYDLSKPEGFICWGGG